MADGWLKIDWDVLGRYATLFKHMHLIWVVKLKLLVGFHNLLGLVSNLGLDVLLGVRLCASLNLS